MLTNFGLSASEKCKTPVNCPRHKTSKITTVTPEVRPEKSAQQFITIQSFPYRSINFEESTTKKSLYVNLKTKTLKHISCINHIAEAVSFLLIICEFTYKTFMIQSSLRHHRYKWRVVRLVCQYTLNNNKTSALEILVYNWRLVSLLFNSWIHSPKACAMSWIVSSNSMFQFIPLKIYWC